VNPATAKKEPAIRVFLRPHEPPPINESSLRVINLTKWTEGKNGEKAVYGGADAWKFEDELLDE